MQPVGHFGVDVTGRLVGDQQFGPVDDGAGDRHPLLLAAGQGRGTGAGAVGEADPGEHFAHRAFDLALAGAGNAQRQGDIVECRKMPDQPEILEDDADAAAVVGQRIARRIGHLLAEQSNPAAGRPLGEVEQLEERCLARTRRTGEEVEAAFGQPEIEVAQDFGARAVAQADAVEFRDRSQLTSLPLSIRPWRGPRLAKLRAFLFTRR